jgi:hypothetical protein
LILASWMKKVAPQSRAIYWYIAVAVMLVPISITSFNAGFFHMGNPHGSIFNLVYWVIAIVARFSFRSSIEEHYNTAEPIGLTLSGVMTFFFGCIYFQYHFNEIVRRKTLARGGYTAI